MHQRGEHTFLSGGSCHTARPCLQQRIRTRGGAMNLNLELVMAMSILRHEARLRDAARAHMDQHVPPKRSGSVRRGCVRLLLGAGATLTHLGEQLSPPQRPELV